MGEVVGLFIAFGLAIGGGESTRPDVHDMYMDAARQSFNAGYIQSGIKPVVDKQLKDIERKYVPKVVLQYGSTTAIIVKTLVQGKLTLTWSF